MPEPQTGIKPPSQPVMASFSFEKAFEDEVADGSASDGIHSSDDQFVAQAEAAGNAPDTATVAGTYSGSAGAFQFPRMASGTDDELLREPQRQWIQAAGNSFSSTETLDEAPKDGVPGGGGGGGKGEAAPLGRKITHQWEQEERKRQW